MLAFILIMGQNSDSFDLDEGRQADEIPSKFLKQVGIFRVFLEVFSLHSPVQSRLL
jgi:hypothetical protein